MVDCWIALGTNQGERKQYLDKALSLIKARIGSIQKKSTVYETEPWGVIDQPWFLNQVVVINTSLDPHEILKQLKDIEEACGRQEREKWHEREIDLDILFYGDQRLNENSLKIPHPEIPNRRFTLVPMLDVDPDKVHPVNGSSVKNLLIECEDNCIVIPYKCSY